MAVQTYEHPSNPLHRDPRVRRCQQVLPMVHESSVDHHPQSDLTCSGSGSKKRARPNEITSMAISQHLDHRVHGSLGASISGRPTNVAPVAGGSTAPACLSKDLVAGFNNQGAEIDAFVRQRTQHLRLGLAILRKRHFSTLLSVAEQQVAKRLKNKEMELEIATRRNAELEEKIRQVAAESQAWFTVAKNNESIALSLKTMLDQVLIRNAEPAADEGYGDNNTDDAESCCDRRSDDGEEKEALRQRRACRACGEVEACVLLLPCRHICVCKGCQSGVETCPVCHSVVNASLQVNMP